MFCKWCGGTLSPSDLKCARCGKTVPPRSDCGGFYDLMPTAQRKADPDPMQRVAQGRSENLPKTDLHAHKAPTKQTGRGFAYITVIGFLLVIVLLIVLFSKVNRYAQTVEELQDELQRISEQISDDDDEANGRGKDKNPSGDVTPTGTTEGKRTETTAESPDGTTAPTEDTTGPTEDTTAPTENMTEPDTEPDTTSSDENGVEPQDPDEPEL